MSISSGFFSTAELKKSDNILKRTECLQCGLYKSCNTPKMKPYGKFKKRILNIGEAPGEMEDKKGKQWQGQVGRRLQREYRELGIDLFEDCLNINAVNCMPEEDGVPTDNAIACCRQKVLKVIEEYEPHIIILFGMAAVKSVIGHRWVNDLGGIMKWRGWTIPDRDFNAWICPVFAPEFVEKSDSAEVDLIWKQDLKRAFDKAQNPPAACSDDRNAVEIIDITDLRTPIDKAIGAFDYETTGLKPHASGHKIICASVCYNPIHSQVFMMPNSKKAQYPFIQFLQSPVVYKMAHNMKFENMWTEIRMRTKITNWHWDSMLASHILDNRPGITGLKFQTYVNFGVVDYASSISAYLKSTEKDGNGFNKLVDPQIVESIKEELLIYCGLDSLYEYKLAIKQQAVLR